MSEHGLGETDSVLMAKNSHHRSYHITKCRNVNRESTNYRTISLRDAEGFFGVDVCEDCKGEDPISQTEMKEIARSGIQKPGFRER